LNLKPYAALLLLVALFSACSAPSENSGSTNTSAAQQANSNSAPQPQVAQSTPPAPSPAPPTVGTIPQPAAAEKSDAKGNSNASAPTTNNARAPRLVAPAKKIDYGKQPQDKSLVRAIVIKNAGQANLNIESVVPS